MFLGRQDRRVSANVCFMHDCRARCSQAAAVGKTNRRGNIVEDVSRESGRDARCGENGRKLFRSREVEDERQRAASLESTCEWQNLSLERANKDERSFCCARRRSPDFPLTVSIWGDTAFPFVSGRYCGSEDRNVGGKATMRELYMPEFESCTLNIDFVTWKTTRSSSSSHERARAFLSKASKTLHLMDRIIISSIVVA